MTSSLECMVFYDGVCRQPDDEDYAGCFMRKPLTVFSVVREGFAVGRVYMTALSFLRIKALSMHGGSARWVLRESELDI